MERALRGYGCAVACVLVLAATACGGRAGSPNPTGEGAANNDLPVSGGSGHSSGGTSPGASTAGGVIAHGGAPVSFGGLSASGGDLPTHIPFEPAASGGAAAKVKHPLPECRTQQDLREGGGFVQCGDGHYRRLEVADCVLDALPRAEKVDYQLDKECWYDVDCTAKDHGYCTLGKCAYGCLKDADCGSDELCYCGDPIGHCAKTQCKSNADCDPDSACISDQPQYGLRCFDPYAECGPGWNNCGLLECLNQMCLQKVG